MRGKKQAEKRNKKPDRKYNSLLVTEFISKVLQRGKKETAEKIVYTSLDIIGEQLKQKPLEVLQKAVKNASPLLEVRSRRIGGATYQVPMEVADDRKIDLVFRWLINIARKKKGKPVTNSLSEEILAMYKNEGAVMKKREDLHKMAEANKAFAHFARF